MVKNIIIVGLIIVAFNSERSRRIEVETKERMLQESINTLESMYYWMEEDIASGEIEQETGDTYLANIEGTAIDLSNMTCCY